MISSIQFLLFILIPGVADRDAKRTSSVVEKLADLKLNWNDGKQPHLKPCPVRQSLRKDAVWHRHAGVLGQPKEIPLAPTYYVRKIAG